jgi:hypothetical protein
MHTSEQISGIVKEGLHPQHPQKYDTDTGTATALIDRFHHTTSNQTSDQFLNQIKSESKVSRSGPIPPHPIPCITSFHRIVEDKQTCWNASSTACCTSVSPPCCPPLPPPCWSVCVCVCV